MGEEDLVAQALLNLQGWYLPLAPPDHSPLDPKDEPIPPTSPADGIQPDYQSPVSSISNPSSSRLCVTPTSVHLSFPAHPLSITLCHPSSPPAPRRLMRPLIHGVLVSTSILNQSRSNQGGKPGKPQSHPRWFACDRLYCN